MQPSSTLFEHLELDPRKLLELYVYEWFQYINRQGRYQNLRGDFRPTPMVVIEEVKQAVVQDQYYPIKRRSRTDENDLFQLVEQVGWNVLGGIEISRLLIGDGVVAGIEDWCGDNLIVRIVRS